MRRALPLAAAGVLLWARLSLAGEGPGPRGPEPPVMVIMPPPPTAPEPVFVPGPAPSAREDTEGNTMLAWGGEVALGTLLFRPSLGAAVFHGAGTPIGAVRRETFRHTGRELGLGSPTMLGGEFSARYLRRYFAFGLAGFVGGNTSGADCTPHPLYGPASAKVDPTGMMSYGGSVDMAAALPLGLIAFRAGGAIGIRGFSIPMTGFAMTTCHTKHGPKPCNETATTDPLLFLEPRLLMEVTAGKSNVFFAAYGGLGIIGGSGQTAGLLVGVHTPHATLRP